MDMMDVSVNYLAIFVAGIVGMVLGMLWYGPLFGKPWMKLMGLSKADVAKAKEKGMGKSYALSTLAQFVAAFVLAHVAEVFGAATLGAGLMLGAWMWLGFTATTMLNGVLWEEKPWKLYVLDAGYWLVTLAVMGAILALW